MNYRHIGKNLLKGLAGIAFVGASMGGLEGCKSSYMTDAERRQRGALQLSLIGGLIGARGAQVGRPEAVVLGNTLSNYGAAIASAPQTNVVVNNYNTSTTSAPETSEISPIETRVLTYNYCQDFNENGKLDGPEEMVGFNSSTFIEGDRMFLTFLANRELQNVDYKLVNGVGITVDRFNSELLILRDSKNNKFSLLDVWYNQSQDVIEDWIKNGNDKIYPEKYLGVLKPGNYKGLFYSGNQLLATKDFQVIPKK